MLGVLLLRVSYLLHSFLSSQCSILGDLFTSGFQSLIPSSAMTALLVNFCLVLFQICFFIFFWPRRAACRILVPQPGIEPAPSAVKAQSPHHWTARDFPPSSFFTAFYPLHIFSTMPFIYLNASNVVILSSRPKYCRT